MGPRLQSDIEMGNVGGEAEDEVRDLESVQQLPRRGLSWTKSWKMNSQRVGTGFSTGSISSAISHWSVQWVARWVPGSRGTHAATRSLRSLSDFQNNFLVTILGRELEDELNDVCAWYINFLEFKIRDAWPKLFVPVLGNPITATPVESAAILSLRPNDEDMSVAFQILGTIIKQLEREELALTDIVDKLYNDKLFKQETDEFRSHANQLVFAALGWINSLYSARHDPEALMLQINPPGPTSSAFENKYIPRRRRRAQKETFTSFSQTLKDNDHIDQPLPVLLGSFGKLIPQRQRKWVVGNMTPASVREGHEEDWIELSLLCFHALNKVANVKIEWVDSLALHLEFDNKTKVLKVFRLPSLCLLMCYCEKSPLSQLFFDASGFERDPEELDDASDFHREVLLSYRLLFGQDLSSSADFLILAQETPLPLDFQDPLLPVLCGAKWSTSDKAKQVSELIEAEPPLPQYSADEHFPWLGTRLLGIQKHVRDQHPNTILSIWNDKRDRERWWTFWAVLFFGGISIMLTLIFGFLQTVLGGYQVYYAKQQLLQQQMPHG